MKKMVVKRQELEIHDEVVYRRKASPRSGEPDFKQLLLPRTQVEEALRQCHAGAVAGHFGIRKTRSGETAILLVHLEGGYEKILPKVPGVHQLSPR